MNAIDVTMNVRQVDETASIIDIQGEVTGFAEDKLMDAYTLASHNAVPIYSTETEALSALQNGVPG